MIKRRIVHGVAALAVAALLPVFASVAFAQTTPPRVVETSSGDLHVVYGSNRFTLLPDAISDADLDALNIAGELDGVLQTSTASTVEVVEASDGTLYIVRGNDAWTLVPDSINDAVLAGHTFAGEIHGTFTVPAWTPVAGPPQTLTPPQLQGKWQSVRPTDAAPGSWIGNIFVFHPDGTFEHAGRFVFGLDMQTFETGVLTVNGSDLRLYATQCKEKNNQFEQLHPCSDSLKKYAFRWRVGNNELGRRVLLLRWPDGSTDEFQPQ